MTRRTDGAKSSAGSAWQAVYDRLTETDQDSLDVEQLATLAEAAFWTGRPRESIEARQREYAAHRNIGDAVGATRTACPLFHNYFDLDDTAVASGWLVADLDPVAERSRERVPAQRQHPAGPGAVRQHRTAQSGRVPTSQGIGSSLVRKNRSRSS